MIETNATTDAVPVISPGARCPACDYDLQGLAEPRCPECGRLLTWEELREPRHPYLFEHHPEANVRSFWRTVTRGLRPLKFWRGVGPEQPVRRRRLVSYWAIGVACSVLVFPCEFVAALIESVVQLQSRMNAGSPLSFWNAAERVLSAGLWKRLKWIAEQDLLLEVFWKLALLAMAWPWATWLTLRLFGRGPRGAAKRPGDGLRVCLYSFDATPVAVVVVGAFSLAASIMRPTAQFYESREPVTTGVVAIVLLFYVLAVAKLIFGLRAYLKIRWPLLIGLATQAAVLAVWFGGNELWTRWWYAGRGP